MKYIHFISLCWKAYNGDYRAALEVLGILREKAGVAIVTVGNSRVILDPPPGRVLQDIQGA